MTIPVSSQVPGLQQPSQNPAFTDAKGNLTITGMSVLDQIYHFILGTSRMIPCSAVTTANAIALTMLPTSPRVVKYADYDVYQFVADKTSSLGNVTASVNTLDGQLATLNVYINNGATQAGANDVTIGRQYELTYVDALNSGAGGFVLR